MLRIPLSITGTNGNWLTLTVFHQRGDTKHTRFRKILENVEICTSAGEEGAISVISNIMV